MELKSALERVNQLTRLLPICSGCKRIRDGSGQWHHVERYVSARSGANFTHGICPLCARRLYSQGQDSE